jgi:hypothetical protein
MKVLCKILPALLAAFALMATPATAGSNKCQSYECSVHKHGVHRTIVPTDDYVCLYYIQPTPQKVTLYVYLRDGRVLPYESKKLATKWRICIGRTWLDQTDRMRMCDDDNHATYRPEHIDALKTKPKYSEANTACLFGSVKCKEMGFSTE